MLIASFSTDDSLLNAKASKALGWKTAHLVEEAATSPPQPVADHQISNILQVRDVFPEVFKTN
jgi:pyrimidine and pyridine-specific 5'-nucleotidase